MDVATFLRRGVGQHANAEALVFDGTRLTFADVWHRAVALANGLSNLGVDRQATVAVLEDNNTAAVDAFVGLGLGGYVRVPLYARNARAGHESMLAQAECKVLLVGPDHVHEVEGLLATLPMLEHVIVTDAGYDQWLDDQSTEDPLTEVVADDLFAIRFTGGTTGLPKGVPTTHRQFLSQVRDWFYAFPAPTSSDAVLHAAPITHASGSLFLPLWGAGGTNVLIKQFDPGEVLRLIESEQISYTFLPPTALNALTRHADVATRDFSSLKVLMTAAAPITEDTTLRARQCFGDVLYQGYGLSECFPITMMDSSQWFAEIDGAEPLKACGKPLPFVDVEIWDDENLSLPLGEVGEIVARCDGQMDEYWRVPEETAATVVNGWIKTGDLGRLDQFGYLYILDRKKDLIISGGFNLYPAEIENVIASMSSVVEVAVVGVPDEKWGEAPVAIVVTDGDLSADEVIACVADELGSYKKPKEVVIRSEALPKTPVGKLDRKVLRAPYWQHLERGVSGA
ncbi:MAG: AMP-binding protein [Pseudomonadales bacterium]|nr:AMP-binding protein [Pseudomonadales bacterium]